MSSNSKGVSRTGNPKGASYTPPSAERKLEKKLAAAERACLVLTESPINGLTTDVNEKNLGKGAMVLHIGQVGGLTTQMVIHRPIGSVPEAVATDWAFSTKAQLTHLIGEKNPFEKKTQEAVTKLKNDFALQKGLLQKTSAGLMAYPNGTVRNVMLEECRKLHDIHKEVEGGKPLVPIFCYGSTETYRYETDFLNALANSPDIQAAIKKETASFLAHETKDPVTGQSQVTMGWASGIPKDQLLSVLMEVISTGQYNAGKWDPIKEKPAKKPNPFAVWGYKDGLIPQDKLSELKKALLEFDKLRKEYNVLCPQGAKQAAAETEEQKATRAAKHNEMQKAARVVNEAEKFGYKLPKATDPVGPSK